MRAKALAMRKYETFWWLNILLPLVFGAAMYCILNSDTFFSAIVERFFGANGTDSAFLEKVFVAVAMYGRDFLWAYSLVFAVAICFRGTFRGLKKAFLIVIGFETVVELIRIFVVIEGAFDIWSIVVVLAANLIAAAVILIHEGAFA